MEKKIFIIFGPTAVGKSDLAIQLAQAISGEIVNMDSAQFYEPFSIGTAKPDLTNVPVTHHLFDYKKTPENFSVVAYRQCVLALKKELDARNKHMILVGGSGFYLKSLFFPPLAAGGAESFDEVSKSSEDLPAAQSSVWLWKQLEHIDPVRAAALAPDDEYRIKRALAIWHHSGKKPSEVKPHFSSIGPFHMIFVTRDRADLYTRINQRVHLMMESGFLHEVQQLSPEWITFLQDRKFIGYNELLDYLQGPQTRERLEEIVALIQQRSRHYAKRQETFGRMLKRDLLRVLHENNRVEGVMEELNLTHTNDDLYIRELVKRLES